MGCDTTFTGSFRFNKPVTEKLRVLVNDFADERHYPRNERVPGYYCQWIIGTDYDGNEALVWDENEKFYDYVEWLKLLIERFFAPEGYVLNGEVEYLGEDPEDFGTIEVKDNIVTQHYGIHVFNLSEIDTDLLIEEIKRRGYSVYK